MTRHLGSISVTTGTAFVLASTLLSCEPGARDGAETDAAREAVSQARQAWAAGMLDGDLPTLKGMYSDDVVVMPSDEPAVIGKEAADAWYEAFHQSVDITAWSIPADDIEVINDSAIVRGNGTGTIVPPGAESLSLDFKFLEVWRKQADGTWKWSLAIWNSNVRPAV